MKRQWTIHREVKEDPVGQKRWDQVYLLILEIARSAEENWKKDVSEVNHASSDLCKSLDPTSGPGSDH
jgi:hypothetical protein